MRRPLAVLALLVTSWSNAAVLRCSSMAPASSESQASAEHHAHAGHTPPLPDTRQGDGSSGDEGAPGSQPPTQECGLVMACGTALRGTGAVLDRELPEPLGEIPPASATAPATADLSQDPPPPRRLA